MKKERLIEGGERIVVAVSGGLDSMVLLHILKALEKELKLDLIVAHLNHMIRKNAIRDENFVLEECRKLGMRVFTERIDVPKIAESKKLSLEATAREIRYEFLRRIKNDVKGDLIATAHHLNDLIETMLYRLVRGTGPFGMISMRPRYNDLIRPLLFIPRSEIEAFAREHEIRYVEDETNTDTSITRNFIRHVIIPKIEELNPSYEKAFLRLWKILRDLEEFVKIEINEVYRRSVRYLRNGLDFEIPQNRYLLSEFLRIATEEMLNKLPERVKVESVIENLEKDSFKVIFWKDFGVWKSLNRIFIGCLNRENFSRPVEMGKMDFGDFEIEVSEGFSKEVRDFSVNLDRVKQSLLFRNRRRGDKIGGRKLKDLMIDARIPAYIRDEVPILVDGDRIVWVPGIWYDEGYSGYGLRFRLLRAP